MNSSLQDLMNSNRLLLGFNCLILLSCLSGLIASPLFAQSKLPEGYSKALALYGTTMEDQLHLYNGRLYIPFPDPYLGSPYFKGDIFNRGTVFFDGQQYDSVDLFYDVHKDLLVIKHYDRSGLTTFLFPAQEKVDFFTLDTDVFITLSDSTIQANGISKGYYHVAHDGQLKLHIKHQRGLYKVQKNSKFIPSFKVEDNYFLVYKNKYYPVKNKSSFKKVLKQYKKEINAFSREKNLIFIDDNRENVILQLTKYCDQLLQSTPK
jgi:hypothetical protein